MEKRFHLRPLEPRDAAGMLAWMRDPAVARFFRFDAAAMTQDDCLAFIRAAAQDGDGLHRAVANGADEYLGTVSLKHIDPARGEAEYAVSLAASAHGSGAAAAATDGVLEIAFGALGLSRVYLNVLADNGRANAFYRKYGFRFERCEKDAVTAAGSRHDLNWYAITKKEFFALRGERSRA